MALPCAGGHRGESIAFYNLDFKVVCRPISRQFRRAPRDRCELTTFLKLDLVVNRGFFSAGARWYYRVPVLVLGPLAVVSGSNPLKKPIENVAYIEYRLGK